MIALLLAGCLLAQPVPVDPVPLVPARPASFLGSIRVGTPSRGPARTIWKDTRLDAIRRLLNSPNPRDVVDGLKNIDSVEWEKVRRLVLPLIYHLDDTISDLVLQIAVKRREKIASPLIRQRIVFALSPREKIASIRMLASLGNPDDYGFFSRLLRYQNLKVRLAVIDVVGQMRITGTINALVRLLSDSREQVRISVIGALGKIGGRQVIVPLISKLSDSSSRVRIAAVSALAPFKSRSAKLALLRLLRTGSGTERLAVLKTLPADRTVMKHLKSILRDGSENERIEAISLLKGKVDNEMLLLLSSLYSYYKYSRPIAAIAGKEIRPWDLKLIRPLLASSQLDYSRRTFLATMAAASGLPGSIPIIKSLYAKKLLNDYNIIDIIRYASSGEAASFQIELFNTVSVAYRERLLKSFIARGDDRLAPSFLKQLAKHPQLKKYLLPYAMSTGSSYFLKPLLQLLTSDSAKPRTEILDALSIIGDPAALPTIIEAGSSLPADSLSSWSNIIQANLTADAVRRLAALPASSAEMDSELRYLMSVATLKGLTVPARFRRLPASKQFTYAAMFYWAATQKGAAALTKIPASYRSYAVDLLQEGVVPKGLVRLARGADPVLFRALARFALPKPLLGRALASGDVCTRVNGTLGARAYIQRDPAGAWTLAKEDTSPFVRFNIILQSTYSSRFARLADRLQTTGSPIPPYQWRLLLGRWPAQAAAHYARKWNLKPVKMPRGAQRSAIRFTFPLVPSNLSCVMVAMPGGGFRAVTPHASGHLVLLGVPDGRVSLHPVLSER